MTSVSSRCAGSTSSTGTGRWRSLRCCAGDRESADVGESARNEIGGCGGEHVVAVEVEQLDRSRHAEAQAGSGDLPPLDDAVERRNDRAQAIAALEFPRHLALGDECDPMGGLLEHLTTAPRTGVLGDQGLAVDDTNGAVVDDERTDVPGVVGRYGVPIGVDANECLRVDRHGLDAIGFGQGIG